MDDVEPAFGQYFPDAKDAQRIDFGADVYFMASESVLLHVVAELPASERHKLDDVACRALRGGESHEAVNRAVYGRTRRADLQYS